MRAPVVCIAWFGAPLLFVALLAMALMPRVAAAQSPLTPDAAPRPLYPHDRIPDSPLNTRDDRIIGRRKDAATTVETDLGLGWRIINSANTNPDCLVVSAQLHARFLPWSVLARFDLPIREGRIALRADDLNEVSDWFHSLRYLNYGEKGTGRFHFRLGTLGGLATYIGHGTIIQGYDSEADFDSPKIGMLQDYDLKTVGLETFVNSFTDWNLMAVRGYLRPFYGWHAKQLAGLMFGVTLAADWRIPGTLILENGKPVLDGKRNLLFDARSLYVVGLDLEMPVFKDERLELTPYLDRVQIIERGHGWIFGLRATLAVPLFSTIPLILRLEWHELSRDFLTPFFDAHYDVERFGYPFTSSLATKFQAMKNTNYTSGLLAGVSWGINQLVRVAFTFADYFNDPQHAQGWLMLEAFTTEDFTGPVIASFRYLKRGVASVTQMFDLDDRAILRFAVSVRPSDELPLRLGFSYIHTRKIDVNSARFSATDVVMFTVDYVFSY